MNPTVKKLFIIIGIILIIILVWRFFQVKKTATENGTSISYREFFGFGEKPTKVEEIPYQPEFTEGGTSELPTTPTGQPSSSAPGESSAFGSSQAVTPNGIFSLGSTGSTNGTSSTTGGIRPGTQTTPSTGSNNDLDDIEGEGDTLLCEPRDVTIEFTPAELARLRELELRLIQIAPELRSLDNVENEISTYDSFRLYNDKITEYKNFCFDKTAKFATKPVRKATPFWNDPSLTTGNFYNTNKAFKFGHDNETVKSYYYVENFFNMSIW